MFILKGFISFFLMPLSITILLFLAGLYLYRKRKKLAIKLWIGSFVWLFLMSYQPINALLLSLLEKQYPIVEKLSPDAKAILALGGDSKGRTFEVLRLYQMDTNLSIICSGYEPQGQDGAYNTARLLNESGIKEDHIEIQAKSRDTMEEALMMREKLGKKPFYLVTAAYHMPRSIALFKKQGLNPIAAPTNFLGRSPIWYKVFNTQSLFYNEIVFHEFIGLLWYKLKNYI
jgi:uncharacterized SAM-binding protein YcdF (DUF218 family)